MKRMSNYYFFYFVKKKNEFPKKYPKNIIPSTLSIAPVKQGYNNNFQPLKKVIYIPPLLGNASRVAFFYVGEKGFKVVAVCICIMSQSIFKFGAINSNTGKYEIPELADKKNKYICPDPQCEETLILRQGKIKRCHFSHKQNSICGYYSNNISNIETKVHLYAKHKLQEILQSKKIVNIYKSCNELCRHNNPNKLHNKIIIDTKNKNYKSQLEYSFEHNNKLKRADVVLLENEKLLYIFEIYHSHQTNENDRPDPWFEFDATYIANVKLSDSQIDLICCRHYVCDNCIFELEKRRLEFIKKEELRIEAERIKEHLRIEDEKNKEQQRREAEIIKEQQLREAEIIKEQLRIKREKYVEEQLIEDAKNKEQQRIKREQYAKEQFIEDEKNKLIFEQQQIKRQLRIEEERKNPALKIERLKREFFERGHIKNPKKNHKYYYIKKDDPNYPDEPERAWKKLVTQHYFDNNKDDDGEYNTEEEYEDPEWVESRNKILLECDK
jgi:hypothetical protein